MGTADQSVSNPANAWQNDPAQVAIVRQMQEDMRWATEYYEELDRQYHGELILVWKKQVVEHGSEGEGVLLERAAKAGFPRDELVAIEFPTFLEIPH